MSGSNAIHGIVLVGALTIMGEAHGTAQLVLGFLAVVLGHPQRRRRLRGDRPHARDVQGQTKRARRGADERGQRAGRTRRRRERRHDRRRSSFAAGDRRDLVYLLAIAGFILALKGLGSPRHARRGNLTGRGRRAAAVAMTFTLPASAAFGQEPRARARSPWSLGAVVAVPVARHGEDDGDAAAGGHLQRRRRRRGGAHLDHRAVHLHSLGDKPRRLRDGRGAPRRPHRLGLLLGQRHRLRQAAGADHRAPDHVPGTAGHQRRAWASPSSP